MSVTRLGAQNTWLPEARDMSIKKREAIAGVTWPPSNQLERIAAVEIMVSKRRGIPRLTAFEGKISGEPET